MNPDPSPAQVTLDAFDSNGQTLHTEQIQLGSNAQSSIAVGSLSGLAGQSGGSLRLTALAPIVASNQFKDSNGVASVIATPAADVGSRFVPAVVIASGTIKAATGLTLTVPNSSPNITLGGLTLVIPPGAVSQDTEIQIAYTLPTVIDPDPTAQLAQYPIRLLPDGLNLQQPAQLTIPIYSTLLVNVGGSVGNVAVAHHDNLTNAWVGSLISSRDPTASTVVAQVDIFADYVATIPSGQSSGLVTATTAEVERTFVTFRPREAPSTFDSACFGIDQIGAINSLTDSSQTPSPLCWARCAPRSRQPLSSTAVRRSRWNPDTWIGQCRRWS